MTEPDDLDAELEALGALQRSRLAARTQDWDRLAAGQASADEIRRERLAAGDEPEQVELGVELFRPFDEADDRAIVEQLLAEPQLHEQPPDSDNRILHLRRWVIVAVALAAAVALIWMWPRSAERESDQQLAQLDPLPEFTIRHDGGLEVARGPGEADKLVYASDTEFVWTIEPGQDVEPPLDVKVFAYPSKGAGRLVELPLEFSQYGAFQISGRGSQLGLTPGVWRIVVVVARPGTSMPDAPDAADPRVERPPTQWRAVELELELRE